MRATKLARQRNASLLFAHSICSTSIHRLLNSRPLQFLGIVSYPLYLLHENMMISLIVKFSRITPDSLHPFLMIPAIAMVASIAYGIAIYIEPKVKKRLQGIVGKVGSPGAA